MVVLVSGFCPTTILFSGLLEKLPGLYCNKAMFSNKDYPIDAGFYGEFKERISTHSDWVLATPTISPFWTKYLLKYFFLGKILS